MTFGDDMKRKADEVHLQGKAKDFGDAVTELVKAAVGMVGGFAAENRQKVDGALDKAQETVGGNLKGRSADTVTKVRAQVDKGLDKLVDQHDKAGAPPASAAPTSNAHPRPEAQWSTTPVPDDMHSAFDDDRAVDPHPDQTDDTEGGAGSPS
ncbi:MAG: antitoxin [Terracoccus sp.]